MSGSTDAMVLLVASGLTAGGAWRLASVTGTRGAHRLLSAVVITASWIVVQSVVLGLVDLGTTPWVLVATAITSTIVVFATVSAPERSILDDLRSWWIGPRASVAAAGATLGAAGGVLVWAWWRPFVGYDGMLQNLVQINGWIQNGQPGSQRRVLTLAPVEAFPMTNDVILGWLAALGRSFATTTLWAVGAGLVFALAFATLLRTLGVARRTRWLAVAAVAGVPHFVGQGNSPKTDVAALAWLVTAAALAHVADRHPRVLVVVFLAGGLSIGAKTTTLPIVGLIMLVLLWRTRPGPASFSLGVTGATATGGLWYVRNLIDHGSPLWPFTATPWGDPVAPVFAVSTSRFVSDPAETLRVQFGDWMTVAGGGLLLVSVALVVAALFGSGRVRVVVTIAVGSLLLWTISPVTGPDNAVLADDVLTSTTRYLLPTMVLGALSLSLLAVDRPSLARVSDAILGVAVLSNLVALAVQESDVIPPLVLLVGAAGVGGAVGWRRPGSWELSRRSAVGAVAVASVVIGVGHVAAADGWTSRHRESLGLGGASVDDMLASELYREGTHSVGSTNLIWSDLAGDELAHDVVLLSSSLNCADYDELHRDTWLVFGTGSFVGVADLPLERGCLQEITPFAAEEGWTIFAPAAP